MASTRGDHLKTNAQDALGQAISLRGKAISIAKKQLGEGDLRATGGTLFVSQTGTLFRVA